MWGTVRAKSVDCRATAETKRGLRSIWWQGESIRKHGTNERGSLTQCLTTHSCAAVHWMSPSAASTLAARAALDTIAFECQSTSNGPRRSSLCIVSTQTHTIVQSVLLLCAHSRREDAGGPALSPLMDCSAGIAALAAPRQHSSAAIVLLQPTLVQRSLDQHSSAITHPLSAHPHSHPLAPSNPT